MGSNFIKSPTENDRLLLKKNKFENFRKITPQSEAKRLAKEEAELAEDRAKFEAEKAEHDAHIAALKELKEEKPKKGRKPK